MRFVVGVAEIVVARAQGDREGGAPLVVLTLLLVGVITLDAVGRGVVVLVRRLILDGRLRRHSCNTRPGEGPLLKAFRPSGDQTGCALLFASLRALAAVRQLPRLAAVRIHDVDLEAHPPVNTFGHLTVFKSRISVFLSSDPALERDPLPVGRPGGSEVAQPRCASAFAARCRRRS